MPIADGPSFNTGNLRTRCQLRTVIELHSASRNDPMPTADGLFMAVSHLSGLITKMNDVIPENEWRNFHF